ncbi:MAG: winged helix DNA-binding domain-containing protein [Deltaproteobacteria bacterium]|nr:winged helix DNA-binding domain-containing protein [Deltaproteobacteria bacterium]
MLAHHHLDRRVDTSVPELLDLLGCIQLDPLDPLGTNADLVVMARLPDVAHGDVYREVYANAFEHFAKVRCILPASAFPQYRSRFVEAEWWRTQTRKKKVPAALVDEVEAEVRERGPLTAAELTDHGRVVPLDWSGWKGTAKATSMALEILWAQCRVVVAGRRGRAKLYDVPERALSAVASVDPTEPFERWALRHRAECAGLLPRRSGPWWSTLNEVRKSGWVDAMLEAGELLEVSVEGVRGPYLTTPSFLERELTEPDDELRILGPLDALLWDRQLVEAVFGFEYLWEVYKPEAQRRWGWYVVPLLHRGQLVGRLEGRAKDGTLTIDRIWSERRGAIDWDALDEALAHHGAACGCAHYERPQRCE